MPKRVHPLQPALAESVAARRRNLRWSQNALALRSGMSEGLVAKLETCRVPFTPAHAASIERALLTGERELAQSGKKPPSQLLAPQEPDRVPAID
jgi:predicted transcriptional regulator